MEQKDGRYLADIENELKLKYRTEIEKIEQSNKQKISKFHDSISQAVEILRPFLDSHRSTVLSYVEDIFTGKADHDEWGYHLSLKTSKEIQDYFETIHSDKHAQAWVVIEYALKEFGLDGNYSRHDEGPYIILKFDKPQILPREWSPKGED